MAAAILTVVVTLDIQAALGRTGGGPLTATGALPGQVPASTTVWVVRPGDTVWSIAETLFPGRDVRPVVDELSSRIGTTSLYPGERIRVPAP